MKRTSKYMFLSKHPELVQFVHDLRFLERIAEEAKREDEVSGMIFRLILEFHKRLARQFFEELLKSSPLHDGMKLELKLQEEMPYVLVHEELSATEISRN